MSPRATVAGAIVVETNFVCRDYPSSSTLTSWVDVGVADVEAEIYEPYRQLQLLSVRRQAERDDP